MKNTLSINLSKTYPKSEDGQVYLDGEQTAEVALNQFEKGVNNIDLTEDRLFIESLSHDSLICVTGWMRTANCMKKASVSIESIKSIILAYVQEEQQIIEEVMG